MEPVRRDGVEGSGTSPHRCQRCGRSYLWQRSTSRWLKMTFCSVLCERGALGFTLETLLQGIRIVRREWQPLFAS